jgi:hypothetical protein
MELDPGGDHSGASSSNLPKIKRELDQLRVRLRGVERKRLAGEPYDEADYAAIQAEIKKLNELRDRMVGRELGDEGLEPRGPLDAALDFLVEYKMALLALIFVGGGVWMLFRVSAAPAITAAEKQGAQKTIQGLTELVGAQKDNETQALRDARLEKADREKRAAARAAKKAAAEKAAAAAESGQASNSPAETSPKSAGKPATVAEGE